MVVAIYISEKNHYTFLYELLEQLPENCNVHIYTEAEYEKSFFKGNPLFIKSSLLKLFFYRERYDKIIIDELNDIQIFLLLAFTVSANKVHLVIHNLISWFQPVFRTSLRNRIVSFYRNFLTKFFKKYIVVGTQLKQWGITRFPDKEFKFIPFGLNGVSIATTNIRSNYKKVDIVIPGMVSSRRNYANIVELILNESFREHFHFTLLGRPFDKYGEQILGQIRNLKNVTTFDSFIEHEEYKQRLEKCDFILSDFHSEFITMFGQKEIYGQTKETGVVFLMLSYGKPGILPTHYQGMPEVQSQILRFSDFDSLLKIFESLKEDFSIKDKLKEEASNNRRKLNMMIDKI